MKKVLLMTTMLMIGLNTFAQTNIYTSKDFVATCPAKYIGYVDREEGGPGAYCACPDENIKYIDKSEGGSGPYCANDAVAVAPVEDVRVQKKFVETCPVKYLEYIDKAEGGPGAYCNCPDEKISYLDKAEGGPGAYCRP